MRSIMLNHLSFAANPQKKQYMLAVNRILNRGIYLAGPENEALKKRLTTIFGKHIITVGSGHDAILLSLQSLSLRTQDEVIVPANAYPTAFAVALAGAKVVFADVDHNGQLSLESTQKVITAHTKVIVMVHMYGLCGDIQGMQSLARKHKALLLEDCAQSFGTTYNGQYTGTIGHIGCFSFYPTKNIGALGDGGAIHTKSAKIASKIQLLSVYGEKKRYESRIIAGHSRLPEIQAAGLVISLKQSKSQFRKRKKIADWYKKSLTRPLLTQYIKLLHSDAKSSPVVHLLIVRAKYRNALKKYLEQNNVHTAIHYPHPTHLVRAFANLRYKKGDFPNTEQLSKEILSLPYHAHMTKSDILRVTDHICAFYETHP